MCFFTKQSKDATILENRFNAKLVDRQVFTPKQRIIGFEFPKTPVITNKNESSILHYQWGLIPHWAKDSSIKKYTLNAKIETLAQKPSFRDVVNNRCLIIADGFYEWQWLDPKGKNKQQYLISLPDDNLFAFAGIYSHWLDKITGKTINTYSIVTTAANTFMQEIHNSKKRMPVILTRENEKDWLDGHPVENFREVALTLKADKYLSLPG